MPVLKDLFPTAVMIDNISRNFTADEIEYFKNLKIINNMFNLRTENSYILDAEEMADLKRYIQDSVNNYFTDIYQPSNEVEIYITQSWINISDTNDQHHPHSHPNSFISGILYISADRNIDSINFYKPEHSTIKIVPMEYNHYNSSSWYFNVGFGDLILFPSFLKHSVDIVKESEIRKERISLSFNTFLKGTVGSNETLSELKL
jgi:uncharacterized protein (TIGR02466 family)